MLVMIDDLKRCGNVQTVQSIYILQNGTHNNKKHGCNTKKNDVVEINIIGTINEIPHPCGHMDRVHVAVH